MEETASTEQSLVALRAALLAFYYEHTLPSDASRF